MIDKLIKDMIKKSIEEFKKDDNKELIEKIL